MTGTRKTSSADSYKRQVNLRAQELIQMTDAFAKARLDEDYRQLCEKLILKMARKRQVPFLSGRPEIWAAAVVYAIGSINFLFDKSFKPYVNGEDIARFFNASVSTVGQKAGKIRQMFKMDYYDPEFSTQHMHEGNPMAGFAVTQDGYILKIPRDFLKLIG